MKALLGVVRSGMIYHGPDHIGRMTRFYSRMVKPGDLVFDVGAHAGDRTRAFLRLGCKVVAVEPQPAFSLLLKLVHSRNPEVEIVAAALGDGAASIKLAVNTKNPTVSTASADFIQTANAGAAGWEGQSWDREVTVRATTLDALIAKRGIPAFVKIDVEGFEDRVLTGLSQALPALSFEFTTHQKQVALRALERLRALGNYRFNACLGETWTEAFKGPRSEGEVVEWLSSLPPEANSGDIYCFRI